VFVAALGAVMLLCLLAWLAPGPIMWLVGAKAEAVVTRPPGVLLGALAAQYVIDGFRSVFTA
jgi:multiple antibiotic resistance protein